MKIKYITLFIGFLLLISCERQELFTGEETEILENRIAESQEEIVTLNSGIRLSRQGSDYIFQSDILLTPEQVGILDQPMITRSGYSTDWRKRWTGNIIYYSIANDFRKRPELERAIEHWSERTNLKFYTRTNQKNYIEFASDPNICDSYIGMIGGKQRIRIADWAEMGDIAHEIGHAIGLVHEQCRPDRDDCITILYDNIIKDKWHNYDKLTSGVGVSNITTPFDFQSLMLYGSWTSFAINPQKPTMVKKSDGKGFYQPSQLSKEDVLSVNTYLYSIEKFQIDGDDALLIPTDNAWYHIMFVPSDATVTWSISPANSATIVSGQGTQSICLSVNSNTITSLKATIRFKSGYVRTVPDFNIIASKAPIIKGIKMFKYGQGTGEYTLQALVTDPSATCTWESDQDTRFYEILYPDDASFLEHPNLFKAIDFYTTGTHNITLFATNSYSSSSYSQSVFAEDKKDNWSFSIFPNPVTAGEKINLNVTSNHKFRSIERYTISIYKNNKLMCQSYSNQKNISIDISALAQGKYIVIVDNGISKCSQILYIN